MSHRQEKVKFVKKSGGSLGNSSSTENSVQGLSKPSNMAQPIIDQSEASNLKENAGYRLRSKDQKLAFSIMEAVSTLSAKNQKTLQRVAYSKKFRGFEDMASKDPQLAVELLQKRFPELLLTENVAETKVSGRSGHSDRYGRSGLYGGSAVSGRSGPPERSGRSGSSGHSGPEDPPKY